MQSSVLRTENGKNLCRRKTVCNRDKYKKTIKKSKRKTGFAVRLEAFMAERGLTQKQVADAAGVTQGAVSQWFTEERMPGAMELHRFAKANGVTAGVFLELTETENLNIVPPVKRTWENLLEELRRATKPSGKVSELADFLTKKTGRNVPLASVSRWLADDREPGARITMLMLQWVECERVK